MKIQLKKKEQTALNRGLSSGNTPPTSKMSLIAKGQSDCGTHHFYEIDGISIVCSRLSIRQREIIQTEIQDYLPKMKIIQDLMDEERHEEVEELIRFSERLNKNGMDFMMDVNFCERGYINWEFMLPEDISWKW